MTSDGVSALAEYSAKAEAYAQYWSPVIRPAALPLLPALRCARRGVSSMPAAAPARCFRICGRRRPTQR